MTIHTARDIYTGKRPFPHKLMRRRKEVQKGHPLAQLSQHTAAIRQTRVRDLPVLGFAQGGQDGNDILGNEPIDWLYRPPNLANVKDAFAVFVTGDSMLPKFKAGDLVYINPGKKAESGNFVLVELEGHKGFIKQFVRKAPDSLILRQFNPERELRINYKRLIHLMTVVEPDSHC